MIIKEEIIQQLRCVFICRHSLYMTHTNPNVILVTAI